MNLFSSPNADALSVTSQPAPTRRKESMTTTTTPDVYDPAQQDTRVEFAADFILKGKAVDTQEGRKFATCFEMGDGQEVAARLYAIGLKSPRFLSALDDYYSVDSARRAYEALPTRG